MCKVSRTNPLIEADKAGSQGSKVERLDKIENVPVALAFSECDYNRMRLVLFLVDRT
jgi:hypothetical protein